MNWLRLLFLASVTAGPAIAAHADVDAFLSRPGERPVAPWPSGVVTASEPRLGVPTFFWASPELSPRTLRAQGLAPAEAARRHLLAHAALYRGEPAQWAAASVAHVHDTGQGAIIVTFQQRVAGVRVFRDELKVVMDRELSLVALAGYLTPELTRRGTFSLTATSAVAAAWQEETRALAEPIAPTSSVPDSQGYLEWNLPGRWARARPVWFPVADGLVPAFSIELESAAGATAWVISAADGAPLFRQDLTAAHSYFVWADPATKVPLPGPEGAGAMPHPTGLVDGFTPGRVPQQLVTLDHAGLSTNDPWLPPGATDTDGNNVHAFTDSIWPDGFTPGPGGDLRTQVSSPGVFQYPYNTGLGASANDTQRRASVVQLFYVTNFLHDWFYDAGFDERAGNAQRDNFLRGGVGLDPLRAESLDFSGWNNANMMTPGDGRSPRMQMYQWAPAPERDSALDTTIVAHEYGHLVSNRLVGNATGLSNHQGSGLGEGWSDFHAALLLAAGDDLQVPSNSSWQGVYAVGSYSDGSPNSAYFGLRRYPLSTDLAKNPLTFTHIQRGVALPSGVPISPGYWPNNDEEHNAGEVWAVMLWECYTALLRDARYTFSQAQERMKRYLVAAYKATPLAPTFLEARDALLAVAAATDPSDYLALWTAFARRGIGGGATGPDRYNLVNQPVTESYTVSNSVRLLGLELREETPRCDGDGTLDADEEGVLVVQVRNLGVLPLAAGRATLTVSTSAPGVRFPDGATLSLPELAPFEVRGFTVRVAVGHVLGPQSAEFTATVAGASLFPPSASARASWRLNVDEQPASSASDDFEATTQVWTPGADARLNTTGSFRPVQVTVTQRIWAALPGASAADVWLTTPPLQVGAGPLVMTFQHRYEFERDTTAAFDGAVLELSTDDGATWQDVGASSSPGYTDTLTAANQSANPLAGRRAFAGRSARFPEFRTETLDLGTTWAGKTVRVRFRVGSDDLVRLESRGWEVDDVRFTGLVNTPFPKLVADPNSCTNHPPVATVGPALTVKEGERVVLEGRGTDLDGDPVTLIWTQTAGPAGVLRGADFIAPTVTQDQALTLTLTAHDGRVASAPADLAVTVQNVNRAPTVEVPAGWRLTAGQRVTVRGSVHDDDGDALTYAWSQQSGPPVVLEGAATPEVSFVAPAATQLDQVVVLQLLASDGRDTSPPARIELTVPAVVEIEPEPPPMTPSGCGCRSGADGWPALALLVWALRGRRRSGQAPA